MLLCLCLNSFRGSPPVTIFTASNLTQVIIITSPGLPRQIPLLSPHVLPILPFILHIEFKMDLKSCSQVVLFLYNKHSKWFISHSEEHPRHSFHRLKALHKQPAISFHFPLPYPAPARRGFFIFLKYQTCICLMHLVLAILSAGLFSQNMSHSLLHIFSQYPMSNTILLLTSIS